MSTIIGVLPQLIHAGQLTSCIILIHRIDRNFVIKVSDFGLSETIDITKDYFRQDQTEAIKLPIKWMALESINDAIFSEKTDVVRMFVY